VGKRNRRPVPVLTGDTSGGGPGPATEITAADRRAEANRNNARRSTGPRTARGKAASKVNAVRHGLLSGTPLLPSESPDEWQKHYRGIVEAVAPSGQLETELAGLAALHLWRLRRLGVFEAALAAANAEGAAEEDTALAAAELRNLLAKRAEDRLRDEREPRVLAELIRRLPGMPDEAPLAAGDAYLALEEIHSGLLNGCKPGLDTGGDEFLSALGVPREAWDYYWLWDGWTAGMVKKGVALIAARYATTPEKVFAAGLKSRQETEEDWKASDAERDARIRELEGRIPALAARARQRHLLPDPEWLDRIMRYEAHIGRQMLQALHTLGRLQAARAGGDDRPPAVLDATVNGALPGPEA
jgi:hypothetical protein